MGYRVKPGFGVLICGPRTFFYECSVSKILVYWLRLEILHKPGSIEWNLQITDISIADSGFYECQVSTKEVLQKESGRHLSYIYSCCTYMELFQ
jgi:hypothetical protein